MATTSSSSISVSSLGGSSAPLQVTGLASGLDTNSIITELMSIQQQPVTRLQNQESGVKALNTNLSGIQSALQTLVSNAQSLSSTSLFANSQTATSSNSTLVSASTTSSVGAVVGGYQVAVSKLATAAQQTFSYTSQSSANVVSIGPAGAANPPTYHLAAGASSQDLVNAVNADSTGTVWATLVNGNIVFSDRTTGANSAFTASDSAGALQSQAAQTAGQNAAYTVNDGTTQYSQSNTVTDAIPGVTLSFGGVTGSNPVTVQVSAPSLSTSAIQSALQTFVSSYNSVLSQLNTEISEAPSSSDPTQGTLYGDSQFRDLLSNMRQAMYSSGSGLTSGMATMMDIGVSTGATTGSSSPSQSAISGQLSIDATKLTQAIQSNPSGVVAVLKSWSQSFSNLVNQAAEPGGTIDSRIQGDDTQISDLDNRIATMQAALTDKQNALEQEFANLESALSQNQSTASWLTSQISSLSAG